jgi:two-component system cell cycle sensor histidine kinase/response regulator CckA
MTLPTEHAERIIEEAAVADDGRAAVIATDARGVIIYWNANAAALYGWEASKAIGANILDVTPTRNSADEAAQIMESLRRGETWEGKFIVRHRDGTPLLTYVTDTPVREGDNVVGIIGVSRRA